MKLESQVCSLEIAKKLKKLGVKQESLYFHRGVSNNTDPVNWYYSWSIVDNLKEATGSINNARLQYFSAFTVAELWELCSWDKIVFSNIDKDWKVQYQANGHTENDVRCFDSRNGSDAMAKMLIYLLENNLVTPPTKP